MREGIDWTPLDIPTNNAVVDLIEQVCGARVAWGLSQGVGRGLWRCMCGVITKLVSGHAIPAKVMHVSSTATDRRASCDRGRVRQGGRKHRRVATAAVLLVRRPLAVRHQGRPPLALRQQHSARLVQVRRSLAVPGPRGFALGEKKCIEQVVYPVFGESNHDSNDCDENYHYLEDSL